MEKICVAVRMRPSKSEESSGGCHWKIEDNRISLHKTHGTPIPGVSYAFDHVFDESSANDRVYELLAKEIVHSSVDGFNGTVFAYGQTSSGKTFTMNGSQEERGIIQQAVKDIFEKIQMVSNREFLIRISYMEIYNEEIHDLFTVKNEKLQIHESLENGIFVAGLKEEIVNNPEQVLKLIKSGEVNRHLGETNMNAHSSRSHTIFRMVIESKGKGNSSPSDCSSTDAVRVSVLNLVDLAGSERIAKTGAGGVRLKEGKHINKSLMVLGNVINKLSDGAKRRGHIPYRDSKLTRILQTALGGNAKTSIICTLAPEEVHVEETKGTLQFASRAKSVTNCVQVNEILTDAALLKRQKLEIEKLRKKLEGSHTEVLEQEVLKLRNEMLTNELEREKLAMELEEERKSRREHVQCSKEQPMKMDNLSNLLPSDSDWNFNETREIFHEEHNTGNSTCQGDIFKTPTFKVAPNAFVFKRPHYSRLPDCSPLPDAFSTVADEDTWLEMNKGYVANLDSLQMTPVVKSKSLQSSDPAPVDLNQNHEKEEIQNLKRELELATAEKNELEKKHKEQMLLNNQLVTEISELQEALLIQEVPRRLCESVATYKDIYEDVMSTIQEQNFIPDGNAASAEFICGAKEIGAIIFSTLESHFSVAIDGHTSFIGNDSLIQEQRKMLVEKLTSTLTTDTPTIKKRQVTTPICSCEHNKDCNSGACLKEKGSNELKNIKETWHGLEEELDLTNQHLQVCEQRYDGLKMEFQHLNEERNLLLQSMSEAYRKIMLVTDEKENVLKEFNKELKRRKDLEEEIKQFSLAFSLQQKSLMSFHTEFASKIEKLISQNPI